MKKIILMVWFIFLAIPLFALRVELSSDTFATTGRSANRNLFVTNNSHKIVALEIYAQSRMIDAVTGVDQLADVEDFLIYPNQLLLQPDEQQVVTLTWVGDQKISDEKAFRIIVEELNLSLGDDDDAGDDMTVKLAALTKVVKAAYVTPSNAKPNVIIRGANIVQSDTGVKKIRLIFENVGNTHDILKQVQISLTPVQPNGKKNKDQTITIMPVELRGVMNILAKSQRLIDIDWPVNLPDEISAIHASF
jgi:fimbrial chaperone protein